jgi:hypothetical protein
MYHPRFGIVADGWLLGAVIAVFQRRHRPYRQSFCHPFRNAQARHPETSSNTGDALSPVIPKHDGRALCHPVRQRATAKTTPTPLALRPIKPVWIPWICLPCLSIVGNRSIRSFFIETLYLAGQTDESASYRQQQIPNRRVTVPMGPSTYIRRSLHRDGKAGRSSIGADAVTGGTRIKAHGSRPGGHRTAQSGMRALPPQNPRRLYALPDDAVRDLGTA